MNLLCEKPLREQNDIINIIFAIIIIFSFIIIIWISIAFNSKRKSSSESQLGEN